MTILRWSIVVLLAFVSFGCQKDQPPPQEAQDSRVAGNKGETDSTAEKNRTIRGELFSLLAPSDGKMRFGLKAGDDLYDLRFLSTTEFVGDEGGAFQLGHLYDVVGNVSPRSFITDAIGTINVVRTVYIGPASP